MKRATAVTRQSFEQTVAVTTCRPTERASSGATASFGRGAIEFAGDQAEGPMAVVICKTILLSNEG
jgi:hypothetical protein